MSPLNLLSSVRVCICIDIYISHIGTTSKMIPKNVEADHKELNKKE